MSSNKNVPDGWENISTVYSRQIEAYKRDDDGLIVSIESSENGYLTICVPSDYHENKDNTTPVRGFGERNDGYLYSGDSEQEAKNEAIYWMRENNSA